MGTERAREWEEDRRQEALGGYNDDESVAISRKMAGSRRSMR